MPEDGFSVALIFAYKDRIVDFVLLQENTSQGKLYTVFILHGFSFWKCQRRIINAYLWKYENVQKFIHKSIYDWIFLIRETCVWNMYYRIFAEILESLFLTGNKFKLQYF